jgi:DNA-binding CsgD family transcriptional regulator
MKQPGIDIDLLTPREWEVLALVRDGLTNERIATELGISRDGVKYHVSEILSKLQLSDRYEAARWYERQRPGRRRSLLGGLIGALGARTPLKLTLATLGVVTIAALGALAVGLFVMDSRSQPPKMASGRTGDEQLDGMMEDLLRGNEAALATQFGDVIAREGSVIGGPIGLASQRPVDASEWRSRLARATERRLHGVVREPQEPYPWTQSLAPATPRKAIFDGARDYDIVLVVTDEENIERPWRFSILDGKAVDIIIDGPGSQPGSSPGASMSLVMKLAQLTPPPETDPGAFVVLPPEDEWLPPLSASAIGRPPQPPPATGTPGIAPDGRTGDRDLDAVIDALLQDDAAQLSQRFTVAGREEVCTASPVPGGCSIEQVRIPLPEWTQRLAGAKRTLYAIVTGDPIDAEVWLAVDVGEPVFRAWKFGVDNGRLVEVDIRLTPPGATASDRFAMLQGYTPSPANDYERFIVLPPRNALPLPPKMHSPSVRSDDTGVDALLDLVEAKDAAGLTAALASLSVPVRTCLDAETIEDAAAVRALLGSVLPGVVGVHGVARLPAGSQPAAQHIIILVEQVGPYNWRALGLFEQDGRIAGIVDGDCVPEHLYPPAGYVVPPPAGGIVNADPARRSGIPIIDAVLDALQSPDPTKIRDYLVYSPTLCGRIDYAAECPPGAPDGTLVEAISTVVCHGGYVQRGDTEQGFGPFTGSQIGVASMYAVVAPTSPAPAEPSADNPDASAGILVLAQESGLSSTLTISAKGITSFRGACGPWHPEWLIPGGEPAFLLAPP